MFDRCHRSCSAVTSAKYKCDWRNLSGTFTRSKFLLTEKLTNGALVTLTPLWSDNFNRKSSLSIQANNFLFWNKYWYSRHEAMLIIPYCNPKHSRIPWSQCTQTWSSDTSNPASPRHVHAWTVTTNITATPNERQDILIHLPFDYLFSSFFQADIKENVKVARHCPPRGASNDHRRIPIIKPSNAKKYPLHDAVKPVYNDHLSWYFFAFWNSSRWPLAT